MNKERVWIPASNEGGSCCSCDEHDWILDNNTPHISSSAQYQKWRYQKWRCTKCLATRETYN